MSRSRVSKPEPKPKIVLIYSHKNLDFLESSQFLDFLQGLANAEGWDFWWDERINQPLFDDEIKQQLNEALVVVCLVSQSFLNSKYISEVESRITSRRLAKEGVLVVPVMLDASLWEDVKWLKKLHHFPREGEKYLQSSRVKSEVLTVVPKLIDVNVLTGIFNSATTAEYVRRHAASMSKVDFQRVTIAELRMMPIPIASLNSRHRSLLGLDPPTITEVSLRKRLLDLVRKLSNGTPEGSKTENRRAELDGVIRSIYTRDSNTSYNATKH